MLEDRDYMREPSYGLKVSATVVLLAVNLVAFILQFTVLPRIVPMGYLVLSLTGLKHGFIWQLLSYQFLHANWLHLALNSLGLYFFGRSVESVVGRFRFLQLYFASGIVGGLAHTLLALAWRHFDVPVVGASAGVSGLVAAFAVINWEHRFTMFIYFFPVTMRGKTLLWLSLAMAGIGLCIPGGTVAHGAHLGGLLAGFLFVRLGVGLRRPDWYWRPLQSRQRKRELVKAASVRTPPWPRVKPESPADLPEEEFISREVDPILDKISAHGIQSLTERERRILEVARNRMDKH